MRRITLAAAALLTLSALSVGAEEASFDVRVSAARRHMRAACQAVQALPKAQLPETAALEQSAVREVGIAVGAWTEIAREYSAKVPHGYAGDPAWRQRLEDIRLNLVRMEEEIAAKQWRRAFLSCAHACNLLTMMHEANGLTLSIDAMATLRKKVGFFKGLLAANAAERSQGLLKEILVARDSVLLAPPPGGATKEAYLASLPELSRAVDAVAEAARLGGDLKEPVSQLAKVVERVYELAL